MKTKIRMFKTGRIQEFDERYARIFVNSKRAEYYVDEPTPVVKATRPALAPTPEPAPEPAVETPVVETPPVDEPAVVETPPVDEPAVVETPVVEESGFFAGLNTAMLKAEGETDDEPKKKTGRPSKKNTYETRDMVAE
jgi:hypothetical protein